MHFFQLLITLLFSIFFFSTFAQVKISNTDKYEIEQIIKLSKENNSIWKEKYSIYKIDNKEYLSLIGTKNSSLNSDKLKENGILVGKAIDNIVNIKIPINKLESAFQIEGFDYLSLSNKFNINLERGVKDIRADSVNLGIGLPQGYVGKNVYIGITDWGFDYTSPMFYDSTLSQTRIVAAWDQFKTSGPRPSDYNYGTEYNSATSLLAAGSDTSNIYSYGTHGTHVAGICAGSGAGTVNKGVAYDANLLFVTFLVDEAAVLDAWQWMYDKATADGKRLVINMSWGLYHFGTLDGTSSLSQAITAFSNLGVVFVNSGGNNGNVNFHIKKEYNNDVLKSEIKFYSYSANPNMWGQSIHSWGMLGHNFENGIIVTNSSGTVLVESPYYATNTTTSYIDTFLVTGLDTIFYNITADEFHPMNNKPQMRLRVKNTNTSLKVLLKSTAETGTVHHWNVTELTNNVGNWGMDFSFSGAGTTSGDNNNGISEPSCSDDVISVAAYASQYTTGGGSTAGGAIATFSSIGPRYDGVMKPDIAAPGVNIASSVSSFTTNTFSSVANVPFNGRTYHFARFSGTSMASPMVAGVVALILEANPYLSPLQIKTIIKETARQDNFTGVIPSEGSPKWGAGKINAYAAVKLALNTVGVIEINQKETFTIYPNPALDELKIKGDLLPNFVEIIDFKGNVSKREIQNETISISDLKQGSYLLRFQKDGKIYQEKFIKL